MAKWLIRVSAQSIRQEIQVGSLITLNGMLGGGQQLAWPNQCVCCGSLPDDRYKVEYTDVAVHGNMIESQEYSWQVPYCAVCREHASKFKEGLLVIILAIIISATMLFFGIYSNILGFIAGGIALVIILNIVGYIFIRKARNIKKKSCVCLCAKPVKYDKREGNVHTFYFKSRVFGISFAKANGVDPEIL